MQDISKMSAVVTGGAMGVGLDTCRRLMAEGCRVTIWDLNQEALNDVKKELEAHKDRFFAYTCDVTDKNRVFELAGQARSDMGQVDILVNNAGYVRHGRFCDIELEVLEQQTRVNLISMYYTIHAFLPDMYERNCGHIVNISSASALSGIPDLAVYSATKWAVWGLTESLRMEAMADEKDGVKYTSIHPNFIASGMFEGAALTSILGRIIAPKVKTHDKVARAIVEKGLKKNRQVIKLPWTMHLMLVMRSVLPNFVFNALMLHLGLGGTMEGWTGRPGTDHAEP
jgi:short-subunit dehydrogenase